MLKQVTSILFAMFLLNPAGAQEVDWSFGTDPSLWLSGWRNAELAAQFHPEMSVVAGMGFMSAEARNGSVLSRPRPLGFNRARMFNVGLRFHPNPQDGRKVQALVGLEYDVEAYDVQVSNVWADDAPPVSGVAQYMRSDLRMLVGARTQLLPAITLAAHVGLGYAFESSNDWIGADSREGMPSAPRMFGVELMWWP